MKTIIAAALAASALALGACTPADADPTPDFPSATVSTTPLGPTASPGGSGAGGSAYVGDDPVCQALFQAQTGLSDALDVLNDQTQALTDPSVLAGDLSGLNAYGQTLADAAPGIGAGYQNALNATDDPALQSDLQFMVDYVAFVLLPMGQAAAEAESLEEYVAGIGAFADNPEFLALQQQSGSVGGALSSYVQDNCGVA